MAKQASPEDKEWLANALFYTRKPSTGSVEGDILELSASIQKYERVFALSDRGSLTDWLHTDLWTTLAYTRLYRSTTFRRVMSLR